MPCNWDYKLLESLEPSSVHYLYGKLSYDDIGGGRPFHKLPNPNKKFVVDYIKKARAKGLNFNYLLNSACIGNREFSKKGQKAIRELITWISDIGVNYITVAIPYLAEMIKSNFPGIKLAASKMAFISDVRQAKCWENIGVQEITVNPDINRNFRKLEQIRKAVKCDLVLLVNEACLYRCPYVYYHVNSDSHASQTGNIKTYICYSRLFCEKVFISDKSEIIKSTFIRPEDLNLYNEIGIRKFKLVGRARPTEWILNALDAYCKKRYEGNIAEILGTFSLHKDIPSAEIKQGVKLNGIKSFKNLERLRKSRLFRPHIFIDNRKLDNFLGFFKNFDCEKNTCQNCGHCKKYAEKAVFIDKKARAMVLRNLNRLMRWIKEGTLIDSFK